MFFATMSLCSYGQISPGDLTSAHANLEGIGNCTKCHELGAKVVSVKCLDCHNEIQSLITQNEGYHANARVREQECFDCHSEHHGRNFDMVRFDQKNFDHDLTGYILEGKHNQVDCRSCHAPENIANSDIRKRKNTFLGLDSDCLSCHADYHQNTLSNDCRACHTMNGFIPASGFNHDTSDFPLKGQHQTVDCKECHAITTRNGREFQEFSDIAFADCKACHNDAHNNQLRGSCTQCHNESSFSNFTGQGRFNHNTTGFTLKGAHRRVDCFSCHAKSGDPLKVFQDRLSIAEQNCIECHSDVHEGKYGSDCAKCHNEESFLALNNMDFFDHSVTDYPLEGKHLDVDCKQCHMERFSTPIDFSTCMNCHDDYHNGEFASNTGTPDCRDCHSVFNGFDYTSFTLERHQETSFPLEGAHVATPCFACHIGEDDQQWTFVDLGEKCVDCHTNIHEGYISTAYYPENDCTACHGSDAWDMVRFDHDSTNWPLEGKHLEVQCAACHFEYSESKTLISQNFINLNTDCASCHEDVHDNSFAINGVTDCNRCHVAESWFPMKFDHNDTRFPLEGKHAQIDCKACHETKDDLGNNTIVYKLNKLKCIDCHLQ